MRRARVALVGCGGMARRHIRAIGKLQRSDFANVDLVAVCYRDRADAEFLADDAAEVLGSRPAVFQDVSTLVHQVDELDAASIVSTPRSHHEQAVACLEAGLHVLCEKPLGLTVRAADAIVRAARASRRSLSVAENYRRDPMNRLVRALIADGAVGEPRQLLLVSVGGGRAIHLSPWRHLKLGGGVVIDTGVHYADLCLYYLGDVVAASGYTRLLEPVRH